MSNTSDIKRYLESYKRMFFKDQLNTPRSKAILKKKKEALNLNELTVTKNEEEIIINLEKAMEFILNTLEGDINKIISEEELNQLKENFSELNLEEEDIELAINLAVERIKNDKENHFELEEDFQKEIDNCFIKSNFVELKEEPLEEGSDEKEIIKENLVQENKEEINIDIKEYLSLFEEDTENLRNNNKFFNEYIEIEKLEFKLESLKLLFFNGCLICLDKLKDKLIEVPLSKVNNKESLIKVFYHYYGDLIDYTYEILIKEKICEDDFPKDKLFEKIFGLQCLNTLMKQINKIKIMKKNNISNDEIEKSVEKSINVYKTNSDKPYFKRTSINLLEEKMAFILEGFYSENGIKINRDSYLEELIIEVVKFINKCAIANFDIYTEDNGRNLDELLKENEKAIALIKSQNQYLNDLDIYDKKILKQLKAYPFNENLYIEVSKNELDSFVKYDYLNKALELVNNSGEKNSKILKEIKMVEIDLYKDYLKRIPKELDDKIKAALSEYLTIKFGFKDNVDIIFEGETNSFGYLLSEINVEKVDLNLRINIFREKLIEIKDDDEMKSIIVENKDKYKISNWDCFKVEYSIFGKSYEEDSFEDLDEDDKESMLDYCMKSIKYLNFEKERRIKALIDLQQRNIINKDGFRKIQYEIFNEILPLSEDEKKEFQFAKVAKELYDKYLELIIDIDVSIRDYKYNIKMPEIFQSVKEVDEEVIFVYSEKSNFSAKYEHFIITNKRIYSTYESNPIELKDIIEFNLHSYSKVIKGERIFFSGIFIQAIDKEIKICSNLISKNKTIVKLLNELLGSYREIFEVEPIVINKSPMETMVSFMDETASLENKKLVKELKLNLEGNKFYDLMSDLLNCGEIDLNEIILEVSKVISSEINKKIFFKEISAEYSEKISNACKSYVLEIDKAEEIFLVYDNSRFGSAKEGFILSDKGVYCKNRMDNPWFMELKYIDRIKVKDNNKILLNNRIIEFPHIKGKEYLYEMRDLLELIIFINKINQPMEKSDEDRTEVITYTIELLNSIKSENLRKFLYMHTEGKLAEKKFNAAVNSYADLEDNESPILLFDCSTFAFGNSGFLVTTKNIYSKESMGKSIKFNLGALYKIKYKASNFYINSVLLKLNGLTDNDKIELAEKMTELLEYLKDNFVKKVNN